MGDYSIADFLAALTDDDFERLMIKLLSEGYSEEALLENILEFLKRAKK